VPEKIVKKNKTNHKKPYRVLTIDGGGIRGLYTAILLDTLTRRFAEQRGNETLDVGKGFDLIVGTSTGAIIAILLLIGTPTNEIVRLYRDLGPKIFRDPIPNNYLHSEHSFALWRWVWRNWKKAANSADPLREGLAKVLGETTLEQAFVKRNIALCVPAVNMSTHRGVIFRTPHNIYRKRDSNYKLIDVMVASISAPMLFPLTALDDPNDRDDYKVFVDGGLWANNPIMIGLGESLSLCEHCEADTRRPIEILSLGSCNPPGGNYISKDNVNWGIRNWRVGSRILSLALEAQSMAYSEMANYIAPHLKQPCKIIRPQQSSPSSEQEQHILMDHATPDTLKVLSDLAKNDADIVYRMSLAQQSPEYVALGDIFKDMPVSEKEGNMPKNGNEEPL
jgi:uncharacterized protein